MKTSSTRILRNGFFERRVNRSAEISIPTGLYRPAQGCEERATLGVRMERIPTPTGLRQSDGNGCNPVGVGEFFRREPRVARSSQPWAECWNPVGIQDIAVRCPNFVADCEEFRGARTAESARSRKDG